MNLAPGLCDRLQFAPVNASDPKISHGDFVEVTGDLLVSLHRLASPIPTANQGRLVNFTFQDRLPKDACQELPVRRFLHWHKRRVEGALSFLLFKVKVRALRVAFDFPPVSQR